MDTAQRLPFFGLRGSCRVVILAFGVLGSMFRIECSALSNARSKSFLNSQPNSSPKCYFRRQFYSLSVPENR